MPAVEEQSHIEFEFVHKNENHPNSPRWEREGWNADDNDNSKGWYSTGQTRTVIDVEAQPAIGEPTIWVTVDNPDYVAPTYTPAHEVVHPPVYTPPVGKPTIVIDNPEYVAAWTEVIEHEAVVCPPVEEPTEEPTEPEEPTTPATPEEPAAEEPATEEPVTASLAMTSTDDMLAQTGADPTVTVWGLTAGALAVALGTLSVVFGLRRRQMMNQQ